jgi:hypothetical protein
LGFVGGSQLLLLLLLSAPLLGLLVTPSMSVHHWHCKMIWVTQLIHAVDFMV